MNYRPRTRYEELKIRHQYLDENPHWEEVSCPAGDSRKVHDEFCACGGAGSVPAAVARRLIEKEIAS
jgi:hypothetical protein